MKKRANSKKEIKNVLSAYPVTTLAFAVSVVMCVSMFFYNYKLAMGESAVVIVLFITAFFIKNLQFRRLKGAVNALERKISADENGELRTFPLPVLLFDSTEKAVWYNAPFRNIFLSEGNIKDIDIKQFTSGQGIEKIRESVFIECEYNDKKFTAFSGKTEYKDEIVYALYFVEDTKLKSYKTAYENSRPTMFIISIDGIEDVLRDFRESQQAEITSGIETVIENWFSDYNCISKKVSSGRIIAFGDKASLVKMKEDKFSLLSKVRSYTYNQKVLGITLSLGVGSGETITECENNARQSLDLALGRGGDQAAVKIGDNDFEFFGGVAKGVEKRNKVRTRMVASAIGELIKTSSNVLIMGHRNADLDSLGSAVGVALICNALGKEANIVMSSKDSLAMPLANHLVNAGFDSIFAEPENAEEFVGSGTLLVIVDTHRKTVLESAKLFELAEKVVVIDHHRKNVDHINNAVIFFHEPNASSASEMVTELIQYIPAEVNVPPACAEALLSGITLDTKNFVMKTGVRTFEAAAYLRSLGADTISVKQLFSNSINTQKDKSEVVKNAAVYEKCAVSVVDFESDNVRIVAGQAADELLNVDGVIASFVLFKTGDTINISARSYGGLNVQLVMEELGGGGHHTMAAAQLPGETFESVLEKLRIAIKNVNTKQ